MNPLDWLRRKRVDAKVHKVETRVHEQQLHEVEKHAENIRLRSEAVERAISERQKRDPWGQVVANIARNH